MAIRGSKHRKSQFVGTCTEEPKSRFLASLKWHLRVSQNSEILHTSSVCQQTSIRVRICRCDQKPPNLRGAEMAILAKISFLAKIGDFEKLPIWRCCRPPIALKRAKTAFSPRNTPIPTVWGSLISKSFFRIFVQKARSMPRTFAKQKGQICWNPDAAKKAWKNFYFWNLVKVVV